MSKCQDPGYGQKEKSEQGSGLKLETALTQKVIDGRIGLQKKIM